MLYAEQIKYHAAANLSLGETDIQYDLLSSASLNVFILNTDLSNLTLVILVSF